MISAGAPSHLPVGKSKTALRRGRFTVASRVAQNVRQHCPGEATTTAEETFLLGESPVPNGSPASAVPVAG